MPKPWRRPLGLAWMPPSPAHSMTSDTRRQAVVRDHGQSLDEAGIAGAEIIVVARA